MLERLKSGLVRVLETEASEAFIPIPIGLEQYPKPIRDKINRGLFEFRKYCDVGLNLGIYGSLALTACALPSALNDNSFNIHEYSRNMCAVNLISLVTIALTQYVNIGRELHILLKHSREKKLKLES